MIRIMKYGEVSNREIFARSVPTVNVTDTVAEIIRNVRERGDAALREYTEKFDGARPESLTVTPEEMEEALSLCATYISWANANLRRIGAGVFKFADSFRRADIARNDKAFRKPFFDMLNHSDDAVGMSMCDINGDIFRD